MTTKSKINGREGRRPTLDTEGLGTATRKAKREGFIARKTSDGEPFFGQKRPSE
jgi:hypothetical protein